MTLHGGRKKVLAPCRALLDGQKTLFNTAGPVQVHPSSGAGAWKAALRNTL